jgi:hypothetical protein
MKDGTLLYFARKHDCDACTPKSKCCPNMPARKIARSVHDAARDKARAIVEAEAYVVSGRRERRSRCSLPILGAPARTERSERRVPSGRHHPKSEEPGEADPLPINNLRYRTPSTPSDRTLNSRPKYEVMVKAGKPARVAIVAIFRKLLILANAFIRDRRKWAPANP